MLDLDPYNEATRIGFERIVQRYIVLADQGMDKGGEADVKKYLDLAEPVIANHGNSRDRALAFYKKIGPTPPQ